MRREMDEAGIQECHRRPPILMQNDSNEESLHGNSNNCLKFRFSLVCTGT